ncbi:hypothetical protein M514_06250 [Trichuris suis]|uniref:Uncharacterized protein n=1 Tax=Trichuris suis TaxID=68888 RepID=A0A085MR00_9BILA|nr:hypothetical protein M513_06250 [Trichuris suis]KFD59646.1 hypothetical protein M514_06250 [Trichuris suis]
MTNIFAAYAESRTRYATASEIRFWPLHFWSENASGNDSSTFYAAFSSTDEARSREPSKLFLPDDPEGLKFQGRRSRNSLRALFLLKQSSIYFCFLSHWVTEPCQKKMNHTNSLKKVVFKQMQ